MDKSGEGLLELDELINGMVNLSNFNLNKEDIEILFNAIDVN